MTPEIRKFLMIVVEIAVLLFVAITLTQCVDEKEMYALYCDEVSGADGSGAEWHLAIYLDTNACLTCCEDMGSWQILEETIPECGGDFSIWAPLSDSIDVAEVMRLEGIKTPVHVLDQNIVKFMQHRNMVSPIKVLFDGTCQPVIVHQTLPRAEARKFDRELEQRICSPEQETK